MLSCLRIEAELLCAVMLWTEGLFCAVMFADRGGVALRCHVVD